MARWRLVEPHYINGHYPDMDATEWEYKEIDRTNGREIRKRYKVPAWFDRDTIVCHKGKGQRDDCVFEGDPTPSMEPIDDEARAISDSVRHTWGEHPIDSLRAQGIGFSDYLQTTFQQQLDTISLRTPIPAKDSGVSKEEFEALKAQLAQLMAEKLEKPERRKV